MDATVRRILLTGMSGTGKSAVIRALADRGYKARTSNSYGKAPGELGRVLEDHRTVEPLLRRAADHEVQTTMPLRDVVAEVLRLAGT